MSTQKKIMQSQGDATKMEIVATPETDKNAPIKAEVEFKPVVIVTAEQRIKNLRNLNLLTERFELLKDKEDELTAFMLSSDGSEDRFKLSNSSGHSFDFTNSQVIDEVCEVVGKHLKAKIENTM